MSKDRIKRVALKTLENGGNVSAAMRDEKYSEATINSPVNVTKTLTWQEVMEEYMPDELIGQGVNTLLTAKVVTKFRKNGETIEESEEVDGFALNAGLTQAAKMKGLYKPERVIDEGSREQLEQLRKDLQGFIDAK